MRPPVDDTRIRALARELGSIARAPVRLYLTGGATAVIEGWRASTVDVDLRFEPEADELMRALPKLKESLAINIELASPPDFIPELPGWRERSPFLLSEGSVSLYHFDPYSQALSKIELEGRVMVGQQEGRHELRLTPAGRGEHRGTPYFHPLESSGARSRPTDSATATRPDTPSWAPFLPGPDPRPRSALMACSWCCRTRSHAANRRSLTPARAKRCSICAIAGK